MIFYRKVKNWVWLATLCDVLNLLVLIATGYVLNEYYDFFAAFNTSMTTTYITVIFLYFFLYFTGHISQSASIKYWEHKKNLEKYLNSDSFKLKILNQELEKDGLKWEQIIHGKLQSRMISKSVKEKSGSDDQFIAEIKDLITQSLDTTSKNTANPTQIIELVSKPWSAVIDIQSEIDQSIAKQVLSPSVTQTVTDVLEEAITNAVKHGGAERMWLVIKADSSNSLQIQVKNNGAPVGKIKRQSIGTKLFNQSGIWSIGNESGLVVFKIQIDI
jgi:signal transduction histidine kinase